MLVDSFILNQLLVSDRTDRHPVKNETKLCKYSQMAAPSEWGSPQGFSPLGNFTWSLSLFACPGQYEIREKPTGLIFCCEKRYELPVDVIRHFINKR